MFKTSKLITTMVCWEKTHNKTQRSGKIYLVHGVNIFKP